MTYRVSYYTRTGPTGPPSLATPPYLGPFTPLLPAPSPNTYYTAMRAP
jgi:hypothetical protein